MVGSCSSGSSGPSPKTSSRTSSEICCFSNELSSVGSLSISEMTAWRTSVADALVVDGRERFEIDLVEQLAVKRELQLLVLGLQRSAILSWTSSVAAAPRRAAGRRDGAGLESNVGSIETLLLLGMRQQRADRKTALRFLGSRDDAHQFSGQAVDGPAQFGVALREAARASLRAATRVDHSGRLVSTWHSNSFVRSEVLSSFRLSIRLIST